MMTTYLVLITYVNKLWKLEFVSEEKNEVMTELPFESFCLEELKEKINVFLLKYKNKSNKIYFIVESNKYMYKCLEKEYLILYRNPQLSIIKKKDKQNKYYKVWILNKQVNDRLLAFYSDFNFSLKKIVPASFYFDIYHHELSSLYVYIFKTSVYFMYYSDESLILTRLINIDYSEIDLRRVNEKDYQKGYLKYLNGINNAINIMLRILYNKEIQQVKVINYNYIIKNDLSNLVEEVSHEKVQIIE